MKKGCLVIVLYLSFINLNAQTFEWANIEGLYGYDYGYGLRTDNAGNIYVTGKFEMNANFSDTILPCQGNHDIYLARYSSNGSLDWVRTAGGYLGDYAYGLTTDGNSAVIIAGEIQGDSSLILFQGSSIMLTSIGENDVFIAKYDLNGTLLWAKSEGGWKNEKALSVSNDANGNIYICGFFTDTTIFNGIISQGKGLHDMFLAKYDSDGNFQWMRQGGGPGRDEAHSAKCDSYGNIYVCGMFSDSATFGGTTYNTTASSNGFYVDAYVAKYAPDGNLIWFKQSGGAYDDVARSITIDNTNKVYVTGEFNANASFDSNYLSSSGSADIFVASYDESGNVIWAVKAGGSIVDRAKGIYSNGDNLYITGQFGDTATFGTSSIFAPDNSDIFISCLNNSGNFLWSTSIGGLRDSIETLGYESGESIATDTSGNVYATGAILNGGIFGTHTYTPYSRTDMFVTKISQNGVGINEILSEDEVEIYPNPSSGNFFAKPAKPAVIKYITVTNEIGQCIIKKAVNNKSIAYFDITGAGKGLYFIEITTDKKIYRKKIILYK